mmetsp:Transcript_21143/g.29643  ORF Transcript_21143/g.29643 Transcript_21143/m.29643 type:complete len:221 (+) Transcript_21143:36-698(+)
MSGFYRGTSLDQDPLFKSKMKKLRKSMKFPPCYKEKVDMTKVRLVVLKPWISHRITEILGFPDEIVIDLIFNLLEAKKNPDPKDLHIQITGFLEGNAKDFMKELWDMLVSASKNAFGIPDEILEAKKKEIKARQEAKKKLEDQVYKKALELKKKADEDAARKDRGKNRNGDDTDRDRDRDRRRGSRWSSRRDSRRRSYSKSPSRDRGRKDSRDRSRERRR